MTTDDSGIDSEILVAPLEENLSDDPYGTAMFVLRNILHRAVALNGSMNDSEYRNLLLLEELARELDNA